MLEIKWEKQALQELSRLPDSISKRIVKKVDGLREDARSRNVKKLKSSGDFRLRIGDYRTIFSVEGSVIKIWKVGHRKKIYKR